jgi:hypothetical protein
MQIVNSITVAGAVLALPEFNQNAPASRLTSKEEPRRHLKQVGRKLQKWLSNVKCVIA